MNKPKAPEAPYFAPLNIGQLVADAYRYDTESWDWTDQQFIADHPGLVATRNQQMEDALQQLTGPLDPTVQSGFTRNAIEQSLGSTSSGNAMASLGGKGGFAQNQATVNLATQLLAKQDSDRANLDQLIANNPQRTFGGVDIAGLTALNTGRLNVNNAQQYNAQLAGIYGQGQAGVATGQSIAALGSILAHINTNGNTG